MEGFSLMVWSASSQSVILMISLRPPGVKASTAQASLRFDLLSNSILFIRSGSYYERNESVQVHTSTLLKSIAATEFCSITIAPNWPIKANGLLSFVRTRRAQVLFSPGEDWCVVTLHSFCGGIGGFSSLLDALQFLGLIRPTGLWFSAAFTIAAFFVGIPLVRWLRLMRHLSFMTFT